MPDAHSGDHGVVYTILNTLQFYDIFHSYWFVLLAVLLALNLIFCTWYRLPAQSPLRFRGRQKEIDRIKVPGDEQAEIMHSPRNLPDETQRCESLLRKRYRTLQRKNRERETVFQGEKGGLSTCGVYIIHASILLILFGVILDAFFSISGIMNIPEGSADNILYLQNGKGIKKLDFAVRCDRFTLTLYDTGAPKMYRSDLTFIKDQRPVHQSAVLVNHPITFGGLRFYQASYGAVPSVKVAIASPRENTTTTVPDVMEGNAYPLPDGNASFEVIRIEENFMNMGLAVKIRVDSPRGNRQFWIFQRIASLRQTYPEVFDSMPVLNPAAYAPYVFALEGMQNHYYTGLQVMREPGVFWVGFGAVLLILGFMIIFFYPQHQVWLVIQPAATGSTIRITGRSKRDPAGLQKELNDIKREIVTAMT